MTLPVISLPKYDLELPFSKKKIQYRPFVVREEKLLLLALQEEDTSKISTAIKQVLSDCADGININDLAQIDIEYLFIQIRNKSMGEGIEVVSECRFCSKKNYMTLDLSKIEVIFPEKEIKETIQLTNNLWAKMRLPNLDESYELVNCKPEHIERIIAKCIVNIIDGDTMVDPKNHTVDELVSWLGGLPDSAFTAIVDFMKNVPIMQFEQQYKCVHCGETNLILLKGMESFFV